MMRESLSAWSCAFNIISFHICLPFDSGFCGLPRSWTWFRRCCHCSSMRFRPSIVVAIIRSFIINIITNIMIVMMNKTTTNYKKTEKGKVIALKSSRCLVVWFVAMVVVIIYLLPRVAPSSDYVDWRLRNREQRPQKSNQQCFLLL